MLAYCCCFVLGALYAFLRRTPGVELFAQHFVGARRMAQKRLA
jgi:hypothetical protein